MTELGEGQFKPVESQFNISEDLTPREAYNSGRLALDFSQEFSNGLKLDAKESEPEQVYVDNRFFDEDLEQQYYWMKRVPVIQIKDNEGKVVFDFNSLLPEGYSFVCPDTFDPPYIPKYKFRQGWMLGTEEKMIYVSDWRKPQELVALFHEIGHTHLGKDEKAKYPEKAKEIYETIKTGESVFDIETRRRDLAQNPKSQKPFPQ
jgi:hypothetical protein